MVREVFKVVQPPILRDARTERRIIEYNRESLLYMFMVAGGVLLLIAIIY